MKCSSTPPPSNNSNTNSTSSNDNHSNPHTDLMEVETPATSGSPHNSVFKLLAAAQAMATVTSSHNNVTSPSASPSSSVTSSQPAASPDLVKAQVKQEQLLRASFLSAVTAAQQKHQQQQQLSSARSSPPPPLPSSTPVLPFNGCSSVKDPRVKIKSEKENTELLMDDSATTTTTSMGSHEEKKVHNNNNTSSYVSGGGSLKFFKDGRCLLELTHKKNGERGSDVWVPITKKVYWPPTGPTESASSTQNPPFKSKISASTPSVSDSASIHDGSSVSSPWQQHLAVHRVKGRPQKFTINVSNEVQRELNFGMKSLPCLVSLRKKVRGLKRKRRRPFEPILIGALMMKMEAQAVTTRPRRRPLDIDRINRSSRLERLVSKVQNLPPKKKNHIPLVQIQPWQSSNTTKPGKSKNNKANNSNSSNNISNCNIPSSMPTGSGPTTTTTGGITRVKSELFPVTETCTAATMPNPSHYQSKGHHKVKAETKSIGEGSPHQNKSSNGLNNFGGKALPITPTMARIKSDSAHNTPMISSSLISPDLQRVKVEIGSTNRSMTMSSTSSPMNLDHRDSPYISPRKRLLYQNCSAQDNGSPSAKKHRLSTDSRGSVGSSDGGTSSPHVRSAQSPRHLVNSSPFHLPALAASPPRLGGRSSSFSIDSIISKGDERDSLSRGMGVGPIKPVALPASPARISDMKREFHQGLYDHQQQQMNQNSSPSRSRSPTPRSRVSPPLVQISPYINRGGIDASRIDPRLAHLAGVAADPRFGLSSAAAAALGFPYNNPSVMNSFYPGVSAATAALFTSQASQLALASGLWTPPVSKPPVSHAQMRQQAHSPPRPEPSHQQQRTPLSYVTEYMQRQSAAAVSSSSISPSARSSPYLSGVSSNNGSSPSQLGGWLPQYRGEPRVATPSENSDSTSPSDAPLNLSTKR